MEENNLNNIRSKLHVSLLAPGIERVSGQGFLRAIQRRTLVPSGHIQSKDNGPLIALDLHGRVFSYVPHTHTHTDTCMCVCESLLADAVAVLSTR